VSARGTAAHRTTGDLWRNGEAGKGSRKSGRRIAAHNLACVHELKRMNCIFVK
jgi:hypothetical protein